MGSYNTHNSATTFPSVTYFIELVDYHSSMESDNEEGGPELTKIETKVKFCRLIPYIPNRTRMAFAIRYNYRCMVKAIFTSVALNLVIPIIHVFL